MWRSLGTAQVYRAVAAWVRIQSVSRQSAHAVALERDWNFPLLQLSHSAELALAANEPGLQVTGDAEPP